MLEISPVLAGTYDTPNTASASNIASSQADDTGATETRRYTKFDRSATEAGTMTDFSFGDFIDMINPLQHIPLVSSLYREITGDTINPVSRIVGNIVYGGAVSVVSAVIGAVGGAGDAIVEEKSGKDSTGAIVAALFGSDNPNTSPAPAATTQLAQANMAASSMASSAAAPSKLQISGTTQAPPQTVAMTNAQINARAKLQAASVVAATSASTQASMPSSGTSSPAAQMATASSSAGSGMLASLTGNPATGIPLPTGSKGFALDPKKLPYGGVMAPPMQANSLQGNNMAISLANSAPGMQMNHMVYTNRQTNNVKPSAVATASVVPPSSAMTDTPAYVSTSAPDSLPPALMGDIAALRAVNQYRSTASQSGSSGVNIDVVN